MSNPSYYAIIPADVRYDNRLSANEKLLFGELTCLCNKEGYCWATNSYFARLYDKNERTIQRWIENLEEYGYITREWANVDVNKSTRKIYICRDDKNSRDDKNVIPPYDKNSIHNNINKNIINMGLKAPQGEYPLTPIEVQEEGWIF